MRIPSSVKAVLAAVFFILLIVTPVGGVFIVVIETIGDQLFTTLRDDGVMLLRLVGFLLLLVLVTLFAQQHVPRLGDRVLGPRTGVGHHLLACHADADSVTLTIADLSGAPAPHHHPQRSEYRRALRSWEKNRAPEGVAAVAAPVSENSVVVVCTVCMTVRTLINYGTVDESKGHFASHHGCEQVSV